MPGCSLSIVLFDAMSMRPGVVRIWAPASLPEADAARAAVLLTGAPVTALAWDARADKILCARALAAPLRRRMACPRCCMSGVGPARCGYGEARSVCATNA